MSAIIHNTFRKFNADNFIDFVDGDPKTLYLGIGKTTPWSGNSPGEYEDGTYSDLTIPVPIDTIAAPYLHYADLLAIKKITTPSISHVIKRIEWTPGVVYAEYSHLTNDMLKDDNNFYVMTDKYNVYKCINNNGGVPSQTPPIGKQASGLTFTTADGYTWKFMYEVQQADVLTFVTPDWIPVKQLLTDDLTEQWDVQQAAVDGKLDYIKITNGGTGYKYHNNTCPDTGLSNTILLAGSSQLNFTGDSASLTDDYYNTMTVAITDGTNVGQTRIITDYTVTTVNNISTHLCTLDAPWDTDPNTGQPKPTDTTSVYTVAPTVTISSSTGTGATARVSGVSAGVITKITLYGTGGSGYRGGTATVSATAGGAGAVLLPVIGPVGGHGSDAVSELGGVFVMLNTRLIGNEGTGDDLIPIGEDGDFRKVHLIADPLLLNGQIASAPIYKADKLRQGSGSIIYSEFRAPINRAADSTEDIKLVVEF